MKPLLEGQTGSLWQPLLVPCTCRTQAFSAGLPATRNAQRRRRTHRCERGMHHSACVDLCKNKQVSVRLRCACGFVAVAELASAAPLQASLHCEVPGARICEETVSTQGSAMWQLEKWGPGLCGSAPAPLTRLTCFGGMC